MFLHLGLFWTSPYVTSSSGFPSVPFTLSSTVSVSQVSLGSVSHSSKLSGLSKYFSEQKNNVKLK